LAAVARQLRALRDSFLRFVASYARAGKQGKELMDPTPGLRSSESPQLNFALLVLRVACALPFLYHGSGILFGILGGPGPLKFAAFMHVPAAVGYLVGLAQFAGGLVILTGAFLRVGAVCVMIVMLGAIFLVHLPHGFDVNQGGYEFALTELLLALGLLISGPGAYSFRNVLPAPLRKLY
jgi:putative oxidoreductase